MGRDKKFKFLIGVRDMATSFNIYVCKSLSIRVRFRGVAGQQRGFRKKQQIVHYDTSAMKHFLTSVSLQHEPKASDVITLVKKTFFARVSYKILYHEV